MTEQRRISPAEAQSRLRKAAKLAAHAKKNGITVDELADSEEARRATLAYAGYLDRGASLETWRTVVILMTQGDEE